MTNLEIIKPRLMTYRSSGYVPIPPDHFKSFDVELVKPDNMAWGFFVNGDSQWEYSMNYMNTDETLTVDYHIKKISRTMVGRWSFQTKTAKANTVILTIYVENEADEINYSFSL